MNEGLSTDTQTGRSRSLGRGGWEIEIGTTGRPL